MKNKPIKLIAVFILTASAIALTAAVALLTAALASAGFMSVFVSAGCITGLLGNVATDLAPPAMLFTGCFCIFSAFALACFLYRFCPKAVRYFNAVTEKLFS